MDLQRPVSSSKRAVVGDGPVKGLGPALDGETRTLVFFDIDGTLLLSGGAGRAALKSAMAAIYSEIGPFDGYTFHGKTDPQIVVELLSPAGWEVEEIRERLPSLWPVYLEALQDELDRRVRDGLSMILPGVEPLLEVLEKEDGVLLGLVTGNIAPAAELKLAAAGLRTRFEVGGFGSDSEVRNEIARVAVDRARNSARLARSFRAVVVGDTPEDVAAARAISARAIAVATGRHSVAELETSGADAVFEDLSRLQEVLASVVDGRGAVER